MYKHNTATDCGHYIAVLRGFVATRTFAVLLQRQTLHFNLHHKILTAVNGNCFYYFYAHCSLFCHCFCVDKPSPSLWLLALAALRWQIESEVKRFGARHPDVSINVIAICAISTLFNGNMSINLIYMYMSQWWVSKFLGEFNIIFSAT